MASTRTSVTAIAPRTRLWRDVVMAGKTKVVWVLGSGFSKSLGGPLLEELFDPHRWAYVKDALTSETPRGEHEPAAVARLNRLHALYLEAKERKVHTPWRNAEEYLELWEGAHDPQFVGSAKCRRLIESMVSVLYAARRRDLRGTGIDPKDPKAGLDLRAIALDLKSVHAAGDARAYLATLTHVFVEDSDFSGERWQPYIRWADALGTNDEVITLNYDLVVEKAIKQVTGNDVSRPGPFRGAGHKRHLEGSLHKLHGSVDWRMSAPKRNRKPMIDEVKADLRTMLSDGYQAAIGIPGPGKFTTAASVFAPQWHQAEQALMSASSIVFVGYSFPATDNYAKRSLLGALRANKDTPNLKVHIVLGPERSDPVRRLEGMLKWALEGRQVPLSTGSKKSLTYEIIHEPMYAEDFLTVFEREKL